MPQGNRLALVTNKQLGTGRIVSALTAPFLLVDGAMKLVKPPIVVETTVQLGYAENVIIGLGVVLLVSRILYIVPRTSMQGAILLTGYLGGGVAAHVRIGDSLFSVLFRVILGVLLWGELWLRDHQLRVLLQ